MAPPRKPPQPGYRRQIFIRLPDDIAERIDAEAKAQGVPLTRIIINQLAAHPFLEMQRGFGESLNDMKVTLAGYGARLRATSLSESILAAVDELIAAPTAAERDAPLDKLRVLRGAMIKHDLEAAAADREQMAAHIAQLEKQIASVEALPAGDIRRDELPSRRREVERLKHAAARNAPGAAHMDLPAGGAA
jgi:hypothetical protein